MYKYSNLPWYISLGRAIFHPGYTFLGERNLAMHCFQTGLLDGFALLALALRFYCFLLHSESVLIAIISAYYWTWSISQKIRLWPYSLKLVMTYCILWLMSKVFRFPYELWCCLSTSKAFSYHKLFSLLLQITHPTNCKYQQNTGSLQEKTAVFAIILNVRPRNIRLKS